MIFYDTYNYSFPRCEPWCWNICQHLPQKWPSHVGPNIPAPWFASGFGVYDNIVTTLKTKQNNYGL